MAVPTFTSISQPSGLTFGKDVVYIIGTNFRIAAVGSNPHVVEVKFQGIVADRVDVLEDGALLRIWTPAYDADPWTDEKGAPSKFPLLGDIIITNLDDNLDPIPGETVTETDSWTYEMPDENEQACDVENIIKTFIKKLKTFWLHETFLYRSQDYMSETSGQELSKMSDTGSVVSLVGVTPADVMFLPADDVQGVNDLYKNARERLQDITLRIMFWSQSPQIVLRLKNRIIYDLRNKMPSFNHDDIDYEWEIEQYNNFTVGNDNYPSDSLDIIIYRIPITSYDKVIKDVYDEITDITLNVERKDD